MKITSENLSTKCQNSFYGKAKVYRVGNMVFLRSYDTIVCGIINDNFIKFWDGYSHTTMNHIRDFVKNYVHTDINKKEWTKMLYHYVYSYMQDNDEFQDAVDKIYSDIADNPVVTDAMEEYGLYSKTAYGF